MTHPMARSSSGIKEARIDKEALRRKYAEERDERLSPDGNDQYLRLTGESTSGAV